MSTAFVVVAILNHTATNLKSTSEVQSQSFFGIIVIGSRFGWINTDEVVGRLLLIFAVFLAAYLALAQLSLLKEVNSVLLSDCLKDVNQIKGRGC